MAPGSIRYATTLECHSCTRQEVETVELLAKQKGIKKRVQGTYRATAAKYVEYFEMENLGKKEDCKKIRKYLN